MHVSGKTWLLPLGAAIAGCIWTALVASFGIGGELFLMPGFVAVGLGETLGLWQPPVMESPRTFGELAIETGIWAGLRAGSIAVFFWVVLFPCFLWLIRVWYRWGKLRLTTGSS
jgi:hypothetical protein